MRFILRWITIADGGFNFFPLVFKKKVNWNYCTLPLIERSIGIFSTGPASHKLKNDFKFFYLLTLRYPNSDRPNRNHYSRLLAKAQFLPISKNSISKEVTYYFFVFLLIWRQARERAFSEIRWCTFWLRLVVSIFMQQ